MSGLRIGIEWSIVFVLMVLAFIRKKRIRLLPSLFLTVFITFFALLSPTGKVLTTISSFKITQEALFFGLHKSAVLVGMVFISQTIVSYKIRLPGTIGAFVAQVFSYFEQFTEKRLSFHKHSVIEQIDEALLSLWQI